MGTEPVTEGGPEQGWRAERKRPAFIGGSEWASPEPAAVVRCRGLVHRPGLLAAASPKEARGPVTHDPKGMGPKVGGQGRQLDAGSSDHSRVGVGPPEVPECQLTLLRSLQPPASRCPPRPTAAGSRPGPRGDSGQAVRRRRGPRPVTASPRALDLPWLYRSWGRGAAFWGLDVTNEARAWWRCTGGPRGRNGCGVSAERRLRRLESSDGNSAPRKRSWLCQPNARACARTDPGGAVPTGRSLGPWGERSWHLQLEHPHSGPRRGRQRGQLRSSVGAVEQLPRQTLSPVSSSGTGHRPLPLTQATCSCPSDQLTHGPASSGPGPPRTPAPGPERVPERGSLQAPSRVGPFPRGILPA